MATPAVDSAMISGNKYFGNRMAFENLRSGKMRILQQPAHKTLLRYGLVIAEYTRHQPGHRVQNDQGGQFAAGENVVADGDFVVDEVGTYPLINSFVSTANQAYMFQPTKLKSDLLPENSTLGTQQYYLSSLIRFSNAVNGSRQGLRFHHHAAAAAKRSVISSMMLI